MIIITGISICEIKKYDIYLHPLSGVCSADSEQSRIKPVP
jgi:hypothetical protein